VTIYVFGDYQLDLGLFELRRRGKRVKIEPKALDLLTRLAAERHRVVTKGELMDALWPRERVTEDSLTYCVRVARLAVGDDGTRQRVIASQRGRGYRFVAELRAPPAATATVPTSTAPPPRPSGGRGSLFVGREAAMATLFGGLESALAGRGRVALLVGEAGIGKTRTAEELAGAAAARGALVLFGRCHEGAGAPAFWPWVQVVRAYLNAQPRAAVREVMQSGAADLAQLAPEIAAELGAAVAPDADPDRARFTLFDSLTGFLRRAAQRQPLLVVIDDLHWADPASLLLLQFLARELAAARVLLIAAYRDGRRGGDEPLSRCLGELARVDGCQRLELGGLRDAEIGRFIEAATGSVPAPALVAAVAAQTGGNPFFLAELVRLLDGGEPHGGGPLPVPGGVRDAVARRVAQLSSAGRDWLHAAAVFGRDFELPALADAGSSAKRPRRGCLDALDEAVGAHLVEALGGVPPRYRFAHALVQETLYDALPSRERARLHARAGDALAALHAQDPAPVLSALAHHYGAAAAVLGDVDRALTAALRAGRQAASNWAYEEAAAQLGRALQLLEQRKRRGRDTVARDELLLELGENRWKSGDHGGAREAFGQAAELARAARSPTQLARAALGFGGGFRGFEVGVVEPPLIALLEEALQALPKRPSALRARVMARLAVALYSVPDSLPRRQDLSRDAVALAERCGDAAAHLSALYSRHWALWGVENLRERCEAARAMIALARQHGDREMELHGQRFLAIDSLEAGDLPTLDAALAALEALAALMRQPYYRWYAGYLRAMRSALDGRFAEAEQASQQTFSAAQGLENRNVAQIYGAQLLWLRRETGQLAETEATLRGLVEQFPALPSWRCGLAFVLCETERLDQARAQLAILAANDFRDIPHNAFWTVAAFCLGHACATLGDTRLAAVLYEQIAPFADRIVESSLGAAAVGSMHEVLGRLAGTLKRWPVAERHFVAAIGANERIGAHHFCAHVRRHHAEMLLARAQPRDAARARELLLHASATYQRLGLERQSARCARLLEQSLATRRRAAAKAGDRIRLVR
jgi:DNA-binding winged helix-turn-helix (wHTH) protein